jgi:hypothetical protein
MFVSRRTATLGYIGLRSLPLPPSALARRLGTTRGHHDAAGAFRSEGTGANGGYVGRRVTIKAATWPDDLSAPAVLLSERRRQGQRLAMLAAQLLRS